MERKVFRPQKGPQELYFTRYWCNIVIYGGAVFAGKTWALCYDAMRDTPYHGFEAKIFRRTFPQIIQSLVPTSKELYSGIKYNSYAEKPNPIFKFWDDPQKRRLRSSVGFSHLQYDKNVEDHQGGQYPFIGYDEIEHFSAKMFTYMFSRNRSRVKLPESVNPQRIRATCNPSPGSWLADLLDQGGYIQQDGYPDPAMKGRVRYMYNIEDEWVFGDDPVSMQDRYKMKAAPFSFTFVPGTIDDNTIGNENNPAYESALNSLSSFDYDVLVRGNWKVQRTGDIYKRELFQTYWEDFIFADLDIEAKGIFVDTAQTQGAGSDFSVIMCVGRDHAGHLIILDMMKGRWQAMEMFRLVEAFYYKHDVQFYTIINQKTGKKETIHSCPLLGLFCEFSGRGIDMLQHLKYQRGLRVGPIKRQGKTPEGQRGHDKVARSIYTLPMLEKSGIWFPGGPTRWSGFDQWCAGTSKIIDVGIGETVDNRIARVLQGNESVRTDPKIWVPEIKNELLGFSQDASGKEKSTTTGHDDIVDVISDAALALLGNGTMAGMNWIRAMLGDQF